MSRAASAARTRERLLDAARRLFVDRGFNAVTIEEIVGAAGYTRGAFYAHFKDKADIFWELAEIENVEVFGDLATAVAPDNLGESLSVAQAWFDRAVTQRPLARAFGELLAIVGTTEEGKARMAAMFAAERRMIAHVLQLAADANGLTLPIPVEQLAALGLAIGNGLAQQHEVDPHVVPTSLFALGQTALWLGVFAMQAEGYDLNANTDVGASTTGRQA